MNLLKNWYGDSEEPVGLVVAHLRVSDYLTMFFSSSLQLLENMAGSTGLEPAASAVTGQRSNQLNYDPACADDLLVSDR